MGAPRDVAISGWAGREIDDGHAHCTIAKLSFLHTQTHFKSDTCCVFVRELLINW
jgi:hypothetical protein